MKNTVMKRGAARFNQVGGFLGYPLRELEESISQGLAERLAKYASKRAIDCGLFSLLQGWEIEVYTMDGDQSPASRSYGVAWKNQQGTQIDLCEILTKNGWPFLDHGFSIESS